jgi:hypothetical protein
MIKKSINNMNHYLAEVSCKNKRTKTLFLSIRVNVSLFLYLMEREVAARR